MKLTARQIDELLVAIALGGMGGAVCGAVILIIYSLIRFTSAGTECSASLNAISLVPLGAYHGGGIGIVVAPIGYLVFLRGVGLKKAIFPAFIGTVIGGSIGTPEPGTTIWCGVLGFFLSLGVLWLVNKRRRTLKSSD